MARAIDTQVSILGSSYFEPIADLIDRLLRHPRPRPNAVQSGYFEHGYSASIVLLLVAMFESYLVRVRYAHRATVPTAMRGALDVLFHIYPRIRCQKALTDVYVLRDTLFHNHLWEIEFSWGGSPALVLHGASKHPAFGDKKYRARVNMKTRRTKALGLSIIPTRVDRRDARKVFATLWRTLLFLESQDRFQCYISDTHVRFRGKTVLFSDLHAQL
ncbi:MAG: hypothetical protein K2X00_17135 [Nitrospiraceae bacterium]|jgi:hypothetical protein|nr:hypothetical protein [Nitrospiraceae bacterium]